MKRTALIAMAAAVALASPLFAKGPMGGMSGGFAAMKQERIKMLEEKMSMIQKRLECIKGAKSAAEIGSCEQRFSFKNKGMGKGVLEQKRQQLQQRRGELSKGGQGAMTQKREQLKEQLQNQGSSKQNQIRSKIQERIKQDKSLFQ